MTVRILTGDCGELNPAYAAMGVARVTNDAPMFARVETA